MTHCTVQSVFRGGSQLPVTAAMNVVAGVFI